jgi:hypothetical protein
MQEESIASNNVGPKGESIDRIYKKGTMDEYELVNADYSIYRGRIFKKTILVESMHGGNFKASAFRTEDGRWFDGTGLPMKDPKDSIVEEETEDSTNFDDAQVKD